MRAAARTESYGPWRSPSGSLGPLRQRFPPERPPNRALIRYHVPGDAEYRGVADPLQRGPPGPDPGQRDDGPIGRNGAGGGAAPEPAAAARPAKRVERPGPPHAADAAA